MSDSAENTKKGAPFTRKSFTTKVALQDILKSVDNALTERIGDDEELEILEVQSLAEGGYNHLWTVTYAAKHQGYDAPLRSERFVLREPQEHALLPHQIENEIAFLTYITQYHPSIPVPKVYAYETGISGRPTFIAMENVEGQCLSDAWNTLTEREKLIVANDIATIITELGEIRFGAIGGMTLAHTIGPTVEGVKLFRGRSKFHSPSCYDIGPYPSTRAYILACYDKEIYYYSHALDEDIDMDLFTEISKDAFIEDLKATRDNLAASPSTGLPEEPFALVHGDLNGRNIMIHNKRIRAVIDWEFAGIYPLSEMEAGSVDVVEMVDDESVDENWKWNDRIKDLVETRARERGWEDNMIELLISDGNQELQSARVEMFPEPSAEESEEPGEPQELEA